MRSRLAPLCVIAAGLGIVPVAMASHWPMAGGSASRSSGTARTPVESPVAGAWKAADGRVRTPIVVAGAGRPDTQRVAYGTSDGRVRLRVLSTGAPVGSPDGIAIDDGNLASPGQTFGSDGAIGFLDTSTEDRLGQLLVVHNDDNLGAPRVYIATIRLDTGERPERDTLVPNLAADCRTDSSPLLTPPAAGGGRLLYFTVLCSGGLSRYLVRMPLEGDSTSGGATFGPPGFALIGNLSPVASPTLVVLADAAGTPRFHVAVARRGGLSVFEADDPLQPTAGSTEHPPAITAALDGPEEEPMTPVAASTAAGEVAGGEGSGTAGAPNVYVAAEDEGDTKVYRLRQDDRILKKEAVVALPESGPPAPGMALTETVTPAGITPGGILVVTHSLNATALRTDFSAFDRLSATALPPGRGFRRTVAAVSGGFAFLTRDGSEEAVPEHLVLEIGGLFPLDPSEFIRTEDRATGTAIGQPAISRSHVVYGTAGGAFAYRGSDADAPSPASTDKAARPGDACTNPLSGSGRPDRITGTRRGDRITGGRGDDRLFGLGGDDCLLGQRGSDRLAGGRGDDLLEGDRGNDVLLGGPGSDTLKGEGGNDRLSGGGGNDKIAAGAGRNRIEGGPGHDRITAVNGRRDAITCGRGRDRVLADRVDRVSPTCERVTRRGRRSARS